MAFIWHERSTIFSSELHESNWTDQELGFAMGRGVPVFSVRFGHDPYGFIGKFQAFNGTSKKADKIASEIFDALLKNKQTQRRMSDVLVGLFAESFSYTQAKDYMTYLEQMTAWDESYPARLRSAVKHNNQIADAFGVPERVERLIKTHRQKSGPRE